MKKNLLLMLFTLLVSARLMATDDRNIVNADLKTVTVYKSGAELSHTTAATLKTGSNELIIENVSNAMDINSIQIKAPNEVTIMGVEFANNYIANTEKTPRIKLLEDSIEHVSKAYNRLDMQTNNDNDLLGVLKQNRDIKGTQNGLSVAELMKMMDYYKAKTIELQNELYSLNEKKVKLSETLGVLRNQLQEEQSKNATVGGRLILQLSAAVAGKYDFAVSYITPNAYWTPNYDIRVENTKSPLKLVYKANIVQTTGIDWKKVKMSLSTSTPNQFGSAPLLNGWYLRYNTPVAYNPNRFISANTALYGKVAGVQVTTDSEMDKLEDIAFAKKDMSLQDHLDIQENALNVTFDIDLPYSILSNGKAQTATLQTVEVPADYKYYAVPKLDKDVYLLAYVTDWQKLNLLAAEANIILEGTYVGKTYIDPNSTLDTLNFTLGRDKRVVVKREKLADFSSVKFLGSNKLQKFTYEITVKNNKKESLELILKDQYPLTTSKEIEVELIDDGKAEVNKDLGILNWKLNLNAGESKKIRFVYSVKYAKDKSLNLN
ncbi:MAG: DUF4139 domain-containing protein [Bacteroidota bacterium]